MSSAVEWQEDPASYPESDGQPMGETGIHAERLMELVLTIRAWLDDPDTYVGGNQFWYYVQGDPRQVFCPDVYVVPGRGQAPLRPIWKVWEEDGAVPALVIELTSNKTKATDLGAKRGLYEQLGVLEYVMFDPLGDYLTPQLRMWRLDGEAYVEVTGRRISQVLRGALLEVEGTALRLRAPDGSPIPTPAERVAQEAVRAEQEAVRAEQEAERAEREAQRAKREAQRAEREAQRAEREAQRAEQEAVRADAERVRADAAESQLAAALAELERLREG